MSDDDRNVGGGNRGNTGVVIKPKAKTKKPSTEKERNSQTRKATET